MKTTVSSPAPSNNHPMQPLIDFWNVAFREFPIKPGKSKGKKKPANGKDR
jgi:hypothetical protein